MNEIPAPNQWNSFGDFIQWLADKRYDGHPSRMNHDVGCSVGTANFWRRQAAFPNADNIKKLAELSGVDFWDIFALVEKSRAEKRARHLAKLVRGAGPVEKPIAGEKDKLDVPHPASVEEPTSPRRPARPRRRPERASDDDADMLRAAFGKADFTQPVVSVRFDPHCVRRLREAKRWTLREMARRVGTSAQALQYVEAGVSQPRAGTLAKLAGVFGVPIDAFFR